MGRPRVSKLLCMGSIIRERRLALGMTQAVAADIVGVSHNTFAHWESDRAYPAMETVPILCLVLDLEPNELFDWEKIWKTP